MLEDRAYMTGRGGRPPWPVSVVLMVFLVVVYALQCINDVYLQTRAEAWLALTRDGLLAGYVWQLLTFQFLHGSLWHIVGNLLGLWFFGRFIEQVLGKSRFLTAYFLAGAIGGLLQGLLMILFPLHFGLGMYGASAGVSGMFAIFAMLEGDSEIRWNFILPIRARTLLLIYGLVSLFFTLVPANRDCTAHAAHLGGLLAGMAWVKLGWHRDYVQLPWEGLFTRLQEWRSRRSNRPKRQLVAVPSARGRPWRSQTQEPSSDLPPEEFMSREVDPILDKISAHGIHSLTERERRILEAARTRIAKR